MELEEIKERLRRTDGLSNTLGMDFISTPEPDMCVARMKVDDRNRQPFGFLSGGASLALEHPPQQVRKVLEVAGLTQVIPLCGETEEECEPC